MFAPPLSSPIANWTDLRRLYYSENYQRQKDIREVQQLRNQNLALKLATRKYYLLDDALDHLYQLYKHEAKSEFASIYTAKYVHLEKSVMERALSSSRHSSFTESISSQSTQTLLRFIEKLRDQPQFIAGILSALSNEELENLVKADKALAKSTVIDLFIFVLYGSPGFEKEESLRRGLWKTVFISLIKEKKGEKFMLDVLDKYVRLTDWSSKGVLEIQLMRILRRSETLLANESEEETHSVFGRSSGASGSARSADMSTFLDKSCIDILSILEQYIPTCILSLSRAILEELPEQFHHNASLFLIVKFFFYRFLARAITYPEYYGMLDDYYFSEKQRQRILFPVHQRLYSYVTRFTNISPGWSRSSEMDNKIRHLVEKIVSRFSPPQLNELNQPKASDPASAFAPVFHLRPAVEAVYPPTDIFSNVTPTIVLCPSDIIHLVDFVSQHKHGAEPPSTTKSAQSNGKSSQDSLDSLIAQMRKVVDELRHVASDSWSLFYVSATVAGITLKDPSMEIDESLDFLTTSLASSSLVSPTSEQDDAKGQPEIPESVRTIGNAILRVISTYDGRYYSPGTLSDRSGSPMDISIQQLLDAGIHAARFSCNLSEATNYQHARNLLDTLPDFYRKDNYTELIQCTARSFGQQQEYRKVKRQLRECWGAYIHEYENRLRSALSKKEYRFSCLRLRMFYTSFRNTRQFERSRHTLTEISSKHTSDESDQSEVKKYLQDKGIHNFMLGEERFHRFCMEIEALKTSAMVALWCSELYTKEAALHSHQNRKTHGGNGLSRSGSLSFYAGSKSFVRRAVQPSYQRKKSIPSSPSSLGRNSTSGTASNLGQEPKGQYWANDTAYHNLTGGDFALIMQMKLLGFILSDFNYLYKYTETDGWFNEFLSANEPSSEEYESNPNPQYTSPYPGIAHCYADDEQRHAYPLCQEVYQPSSPKSVSTVSSTTTTSGLSISSPAPTASTFTPLGESLSSILSDTISLKSTYKNGSRAPCNDSLAYSTLCTHLTLHPSPFQKLHTLYALEMFIVAHLTSENVPGTDSIVDEIELVFRKVRPRGLIRDMQIIASFIPSVILDLSDEGKVFWDMSLAVTSLKKEVVNKIVTRGTELVDQAGEWRKNPRKAEVNHSPNESNLSISIDYQLEEQEEALHQMEAVRLFTIAAKEDHPVAQRELAILYLSLPTIPSNLGSFVCPSPTSLTGGVRGHRSPTPPSPSPSTPTTPTFFSFMYDTNVKYNEANIASAMYWFSKAATQGDTFSQRYLKHRDGAGRMSTITPSKPQQNGHFSSMASRKLYGLSSFTTSRTSTPPPQPSSTTKPSYLNTSL
ncbi:hypothetical protein K493DRAFT_319402 [Basidiobolus meristosporus CBS 931.73]|uniref:Ras-GAP domain-containing protein n=1 Tax=Basidiobolus meristosporus CBS 931.73 TaxID=1314790 RepID=A0A1Y1XRZ4_9FUNG|nr:hypothetical protein K493DRAFT_319402 [Basidiobolus meristosporus CBS 931.73]|eukprot:ORX88520.1 hypothetical protein K493DRAFT_319402 [Basidiobolus meristosporus CBS 931.73]